MKNIIVLAYAISPYRGSEYSVSWNYILNMSKDNKLTIIYGTSGDHMGDFEDMHRYLGTNKLENVTFIPIVPSIVANAINTLNKKNIFNYSFYFAYRVWQKQVYKYVKELTEKEKFDLIHFLCPIGYREPGYVWKLNIPYMWGPIGGANNTPWKLFDILSLKGKLKFAFRNVVNSLQLRYSCNVSKAIKRVDLLLTATSEVQAKIKKVHKKDSIYLPENCLLTEPKIDDNKFTMPIDKFQLIFVGRLDENKGCIMFLRALAQVKGKNKIKANIIGAGPVKPQLEEFVKNNSLDEVVTFHGNMPRTEVMKMFNSAHLHVISSLSEGNPTTIWEAMMYGVPTLSLDHCGMHDTICPKCGIKIPVINTEQIASDIAREIDNLLEHPQTFETLAHGTIECSQKYMWDERRKQMNHYYDLAIERYNQKRVCK